MLDGLSPHEVAVAVDAHARRDAHDPVLGVLAREADLVEPAVPRLDRAAGRIVESRIEERLRDRCGWKRGRDTDVHRWVEIEVPMRRASVDLGRRMVGAVRLARDHGLLELREHLGSLDERRVDPQQAAKLSMLGFLVRARVRPQFRAGRAARARVDAGLVEGPVDRVLDARGATLGKRAHGGAGKLGDGIRRRRFEHHGRVYAPRMIEFTPDESRVLGTLIEKALTTPAQYPLSLNSLVTGVNQKSNRDPVVEIDEDAALHAIDGLRSKGLVRDVSFTGSRVEKFRHVAGETLGIRAPEQAILAELLLRGPQTVGELRARAARMHPFDSIESVEGTLATMAAEPHGFVRELPPLPGSRAPRWVQQLCKDLHPLGPTGGAAPAAAAAPREATRIEELERRVGELERCVVELGRKLDDRLAQR